MNLLWPFARHVAMWSGDSPMVVERALLISAICAALLAWVIGVTVRVIPEEFDLTTIVAFAGLGSVLGAMFGVARRHEDPARTALNWTAFFGGAAAVSFITALIVELFS